MEQKKDEDLMMAIKGGNVDALVPLFERYNKMLYNYFIRLTYDENTSMDLTQNVFYRLLKYSYTYKPDKTFKYWLLHIARNILNDHFETSKRNKTAQYNIEQIGDKSKDENIENQMQNNELYDALAQLPADSREIIELNRFQGFKYNEIAEITGITESNIKVKVHRAMKQLREIYFS